MDIKQCPQCGKEINSTTNRLFKDECGHQKCRQCVLQDDFFCKMCREKSVVFVSNGSNISVIKYDGNNKECVIKYDGNNKVNKTIVIDETPKTNSVNVDNDEIPAKQIKSNNCKKVKRQYKPLVVPNHITIISKTPLLYKCMICSKNLQAAHNVKYHLYCGTEKPFKCSDCDRSFITQYSLDIHSRSHSGLKPFSCHTCDKKFSERGKLNRHLKLHSGEFEFVCTECGKKFPTNFGLKSHLRLHTGEKPFGCDQCKSSFSNKSNLNKHYAVHTKDKLFVCESCGKKFRGQNALYVHKKRHITHKSFKCENCDKVFYSGKDLRRHKIIHNNEKNYTCTICSTQFKRKDILYRHLKNTHSRTTSLEDKIQEVKSNKLNVKLFQKNEIDTTNPESNSKINKKKVTSPDYKEKPNAIHVIKSSKEAICNKNGKTQNAVPVINGPFKLAFKTDTFRNNYNIDKRDDPDLCVPKSYDTAKSLNIFHRILPPQINSETTYSMERMQPTTRNVITNVGKVNEKDSLEICKKILAPSETLHYETSFENKQHASIKNIKFKLPSTYTNNAIKTSKQIREFNFYDEYHENNSTMQTTSENIITDIGGKEYTELKTVYMNSFESDKNEYQSVIVNPQNNSDYIRVHERKLETAPPFNEMHWRKRTQLSLPKKL